MKNCGKYLLVVVAALLFAAGTWAQESTGSIDGRVVDQNGRALPGVTVEISSPNLQGTKVATTDSNGMFRVTLLPPGFYVAKFTLESFSDIEQSDINVGLGGSRTLNVQMRPGVREEVVVTGTLIPRPTLEALSPVATMDVEEFSYRGTDPPRRPHGHPAAGLRGAELHDLKRFVRHGDDQPAQPRLRAHDGSDRRQKGAEW